MISDNTNDNNSARRDYRHQNGHSHDETNGDEKPHFNEDDYTKITTPRQDVLLKKDYINRRKYLINSNNNTNEIPLINSGYNTTVIPSDLDVVQQPLPVPPAVEFIDPGMPATATAACYDNGINGTTDYDEGYSYFNPGIAAAPATGQGTYFDSNNGILYATTTTPTLCLISPFYNPTFVPSNLQTINAEQYNDVSGTLNGHGDYEEAKVVGQTDDECDLSSLSSATSATIAAVTETIQVLPVSAAVTTIGPETNTVNGNSVSVGTTVFRVDAEEFIPQSMRNQKNKSTSTETNFYQNKTNLCEKESSYLSVAASSVSTPQPLPAQVATPVSPPVANDKSIKKRQPQQQSVTILKPPNRKSEVTIAKPAVQPIIKKPQQASVVLKSKEALIVEPKNVIVTSGAGSSKKPAAASNDWILAVSSRKRRSQLAQQKSIEAEESASVLSTKKAEVFEIPPIESVVNEPQNKKSNKSTKKKQKKTTKPATPIAEAATMTVTTPTATSTKETVKTPVLPVQKSLDRELEQRPVTNVRNRPNVANTPNTTSPSTTSSTSNTPVQQKENKRKAKKKLATVAVNAPLQSNETLPVLPDSDLTTIDDEFDSRTNIEISEEIEREIQRCLENEVECRLKSIDLDSKDDVKTPPSLKLSMKNLAHSSQFGMFGQSSSIFAFPQLPPILTNKAVDISFKNNKEPRTNQAPSANINNNDAELPRKVSTEVTTTTTSTITSTVMKTEPVEYTAVLTNGLISQPLVITEKTESEPEATTSEKLNTMANDSNVSSTVRDWFSNHHGVKAFKTPQQLQMIRSRVQQLRPNTSAQQSPPRSTLNSTNSSGFLTAVTHVACNIS